MEEVKLRMHDIKNAVDFALDGVLPYTFIRTNDSIMSSVDIVGSFDCKDTWANNIFQNSKHFIIRIIPSNGKRYYEDTDDKVCIELLSSHGCTKFRKYTSNYFACIIKLLKWIEQNKNSI